MKAHIAQNQNAGRPTVLCWHLSTADKGKLDGMAAAFGMRVLAVSPAETEQTVAQLLGEAPPRAEQACAKGEAAYSKAQPAPTPAVLFANFTQRDLDTLLDLLKQAQADIPLKAAATATNRTWPFGTLLAHLSEERAAYAAMEK